MAVNAVPGIFGLLALGLAVILSPTQPVAQTLDRIEGPAELPPADFDEQTYVDSRGCVFLRAGIGGEVNWVARVNAQRKPVCGEMPSLIAPAPVEADATTVPDQPVTTADSEPAAVPIARVTPPRRVARTPRPVLAAPAPLRCPADAPAPRKVTTVSGESVVVCTRGDGTLDGVRMPIGSRRPLVVRQAAIAVPLPPDGRTQLWTREVPAQLVYPSGQTRERVVRQSLVVTSQTGVRTVIVETEGNTNPTARRHVQVGAYDVPANAEAVRQNLHARGLPVGTALVAQAGVAQVGHPLQIVLAGPFATADAAHAALVALRGAGYHDAFLR